MKLSFATLGCPAWNMRQVVDNAKKMGFDGVELRGVAGEHIGCDEPAESRREIKKMFDQAGLRVACIMGYSRFTVADAAKRNADVESATKMVSVAKDIGCPTIRLFGGILDTGSFDENFTRVVESLRKIAPVAEKAGIRLAMETHDDWCKGEGMVPLIQAVNSPAVGVCWDVANSWAVEPMERTFAAIQPHLAHVHFKDTHPTETPGKTIPALPGKGQVDMAGAAAILQKAGYKGWLSFEWEKKWYPQIEEPEVAFPHYHKYVTGLLGKKS